MPLRPDPFLTRFERLRRLRRKPLAGYAITAAAVATSVGTALAIDARLNVPPLLLFYPAIIVATIVGGLRTGLAAVVAVWLAVDYFLLPPLGALASTPSEWLSLGLFALVSLMLIALAGLLNTAIERLWRQADNIHFILDAAPTGLIGWTRPGSSTW